MAKKKKETTVKEVKQIRDQLVLLQHSIQQANGHLGRLIKLLLKK